MTCTVISYKENPTDGLIVNTTSRSQEDWSRELSPFFLGPVKLYGWNTAKNVENAWQYSKVYDRHLDDFNRPSQEYFQWAKDGWAKETADRYPMGKVQSLNFLGGMERVLIMWQLDLKYTFLCTLK